MSRGKKLFSIFHCCAETSEEERRAEEFIGEGDVENAGDGGLDYWSAMLPDELKLKIVQQLDNLSDMIALMGVSMSIRKWIEAAPLKIRIDNSTLACFHESKQVVKLVQLLNWKFVADRVESVFCTFIDGTPHEYREMPDVLPDLERPLQKLVGLTLVFLHGGLGLLEKFSKVSPNVQLINFSPYFEPEPQLSRECVEWIEGLPLLTDFQLDIDWCRPGHGQLEFDAVLRSASLQRVALSYMKIHQLSLMYLRKRVAQSLVFVSVSVVESKEPLDAISKLEAGYHFLEVVRCFFQFPTLQQLCTKYITHLHLALRRDEVTDAEVVRLIEEATFQPRNLGLSLELGIPVNVLQVVCRRFIDLEALALSAPCQGGFDGTTFERLESLAVVGRRLRATVVDCIAAACPPSLCLLHLVYCKGEEAGEIEAACGQLHDRLPQVAIKLREYYDDYRIYNPRHWCARGKMRSFCCEPCNVAWKPFSCCFQAISRRGSDYISLVEFDHNGYVNAEVETEKE